jgi:hypothetical protein
MKIAGRKWMYRSFDTLPESRSAFPIRFKQIGVGLSKTLKSRKDERLLKGEGTPKGVRGNSQVLTSGRGIDSSERLPRKRAKATRISLNRIWSAKRASFGKLGGRKAADEKRRTEIVLGSSNRQHTPSWFGFRKRNRRKV